MKEGNVMTSGTQGREGCAFDLEREIMRVNSELESSIKDGMFEDFLREAAERHADETPEEVVAALEAEADNVLDFIRGNYPERLKDGGFREADPTS